MAPIANATAKPTGRIWVRTRATPAAVNSTSPTESQPIEEMLARKSTTEVFTAAEYSSGGSSPTRTNSGVSSGTWTNGR